MPRRYCISFHATGRVELSIENHALKSSDKLTGIIHPHSGYKSGECRGIAPSTNFTHDSKFYIDFMECTDPGELAFTLAFTLLQLLF